MAYASCECPEDVKWDGPRMNPPELDVVSGEGGSEEISWQLSCREAYVLPYSCGWAVCNLRVR